SFNTNMTDWKQNGTKAETVAKALQGQLGGFGKIIGDVIVFFANNRVALIALAGAFAGVLSISLLAATVAMMSFIGVSLPVLGIFAAVGAAVALLAVAWKTNFGGIRDIATNVWNTIKNVSQGVVVYFQSTFLPQFKAAIDKVTFLPLLVWDFFVLGFTGIKMMLDVFSGWFQKTFGVSIGDVFHQLIVDFQAFWKSWSAFWGGL